MGSRTMRGMVAALALAAAMTVAACGEKKEETPASSSGGGTETAKKDCGKVTLNEQAWAGSTANTYIAKAVLEDELGCQVEVTKIAEIPVFQAMADGEVDAVLEDWQHTDEYKKYIDQAGTVVQGGPLGVEGHIGWFIPKYLMDEHPEFADWEGLKGEEDLFKTAESGDQGMFLGGDPSYVQKDKELIKALDLNLKHVTAGAEPAQVARWSQLYKQKKPVLFYWYTPQFYNQEYDLAEVKLPERTPDCKDDAKSGGDVEQYKCAYDVTVINKLFSKKFADGGSPAYDVLKNMKLTNDDQEAVAKAIAGDKVDPEQAGEGLGGAEPGQGAGLAGLSPDVLRFARSALPPAPARVLEVGAGGGELAAALIADGYDVVAIDPASETPAVRPVALAEVDEPPASFDAAVAVVSLHHVEPLGASLARLAELVRPGGTLAIDEFDVERLDERAAAWWLARQESDHESSPAEVVANLREHIHLLALLRAELAPWFELGDTVRGPYLHRWNMAPGHLDDEAQAIDAGEIPATGARIVGTRR